MKNLIPYDRINEAGAALPAMPAFLKAVKAKVEHRRLGGPWTKDTTPNAWVVTAKSSFSKDTWELVFWPDGTFYTSAGSHQEFAKSEGKWKADAASSFEIGSTPIKGVKMEFNSFMVMNPPG
jgi:hypothetical protein